MDRVPDRISKEQGMSKRPLGRSGLEIAPLVFGGNVFGWTADRLDAAAARGIGGYVANEAGS
jgi:hypothetical protein